MLKTVHQYYVYLLANKKNGTLYIGVTYDLERRIFEHKKKITKGFTSKYDITYLVYFEVYSHLTAELKRKKQLKICNREWKIKLIEEQNKNWNDLAEDWFN